MFSECVLSVKNSFRNKHFSRIAFHKYVIIYLEGGMRAGIPTRVNRRGRGWGWGYCLIPRTAPLSNYRSAKDGLVFETTHKNAHRGIAFIQKDLCRCGAYRPTASTAEIA